jgi:hypothetical protein
MAYQSARMWECPECGHSLRWSVNRSTRPKSGEASVCGYCAAMVIFTDDMELRLLDWPDWCMLTHAQKRRLVGTRAVIQARIRAAKQ